MMELKNIYGDVIFALEAAKTIAEVVVAAVAAKKSLNGADLYGADLSGADLNGAYLHGAYLHGKKIAKMRVFSGLYHYEVWAVLFEDGTRMVRMGCLHKTLEEWGVIGIRKSNINEFPDDGSEKCEERVAAFEFAKAAALRMQLDSEKVVA